MAGEFLRSHGIDIDAEMARIQFGNHASSADLFISPEDSQTKIHSFYNVSLPGTAPNTSWTVSISHGKVSAITPFDDPPQHPQLKSHINGHSALLGPSLCHPHVHIDKAYLLSHPKYAHLQIEKGDFVEAMSLTNTAKRSFEEWDLLERGQRVIDESVAAGVTHMRAFVEVDAVVGMKCLDAGVKLKRRNAESCVVQICAFAQLPLFGGGEGDESGEVIRGLMTEAACRSQVDVVGSTPYVEQDRRQMEKNVEWMVDLSIASGTHLDFHLDYNLDPAQEPMVHHVISTLHSKAWQSKTNNKTIALGHCTRLTLLNPSDWTTLASSIGTLPLSFVGLPTSDLFMMRTPTRTRGTLDTPYLIKDLGLDACMGINNIGNAFTPHGTCDPVSLACNGVGVYQAGTKQDAEVLYEGVSCRAREAIGLGGGNGGLQVRVGDEASLVLFGCDREIESWKTRRTVEMVIYLYDNAKGRVGCLEGRLATGSMGL